MEQQTLQRGSLPKLQINPLRMEDIRAAFSDGWKDFRAYPAFGLFFGAIYALGGMFIAVDAHSLPPPWMIIPVAIGFPLIGPFIAVGLYEISRRHRLGEPIGWAAILTEVFRQRERQLSWMAFVVLFIFWIWIYQVRLLMRLFLGFEFLPPSRPLRTWFSQPPQDCCSSQSAPSSALSWPRSCSPRPSSRCRSFWTTTSTS